MVKQFNTYTFRPTGYRYNPNNGNKISSIQFEYTYCKPDSELEEHWNRLFERCLCKKPRIEMRKNGMIGTLLYDYK